MAYIIGLITKEERMMLKSRGWDLEPAPAELVPTDDETKRDDYVMIWVDSSLFEVMSGPDWDIRTGG